MQPWTIDPFDRSSKSHRIRGPREVNLDLDTDDVPAEEVHQEAVKLVDILNELESTVVVSPTYGSIAVAKALAEPWIALWSGDEWGEIMASLEHTIHYDYGLGDTALAILCRIMWRHLELQKAWMDSEGYMYDFPRAHEATETQTECCLARAKWFEGRADPNMRATVESMPGWVFGE